MKNLSLIALAFCLLAAPAFALDEPLVQESTTRLRLGGGIPATGGNTGAQLNAGIRASLNTDTPVQIGADTGIIAVGGDVGVPLFGSAEIYFSQLDSGTVVPFLGASFGPVFGLGGTPLAVLIRPGIDIDVSRSVDLNIQAALGSLGGDFYFGPTANLLIPL